MTRVPDTHVRVLADLLASLLDYMPGPAVDRRNPLSCRQPTAGSAWAPSGYELCPDCDLDGTVKRGKHRVPCPRCKGNGCWPVDAYDTAAKPRDVETVDLCDPRLPLPVRLQAARAAARELLDYTAPELDRALARCVTRGEQPEDLLWVALQKQARYRTDQPWAKQLEAGLLALEPFERLLLAAAYTVGWFPPRTMGQPLRWRLVLALVRLRDVLPAGFRAPPAVVERVSAELAAEQAKSATGRWVSPQDRERRDVEILRLHHLGRSSRVIAGRLGVSQPTVVRVLARARDEREAA